jgi:hypothetical protein
MGLSVVYLVVLIAGTGPYVKAGILVAAGVCFMVGGYRLTHGELPHRD